jgi:hypothetical protein
MSLFRDQVAAALDAVTIIAPTRYAWLGRRSRSIPTTVDGDLDDAQRRRYLVSCLGEELYCSFYCYGRPVPARWGEAQPLSGDSRLLGELSRANSGRGSWERGWTIERVDRGEVVATRARLRVRVPLSHCRPPRQGPRAEVRLRLPKELPWLSPGFWLAVSDAPAEDFAVRVYWNVTREGAPPLVEALTTWLNGESVPFRLKVADHPFRFARHDAAVLYLDGDVFPSVRATLAELAVALARHLRPGTPAFTLELAPGVGLAEDAGGQSFGAQRCGMLAEAIVRSHEGPHGGVRVAAALFAEHGVDIDAPYRAGRHVL